MTVIHTNNWDKFTTETIIMDGGNGMVSIDYYEDQEGIGLIHDLSVVPAARRKGLGNRLLQSAIELARKRNCKTVELNYNNQSTPFWVCDWYGRQGFDEKEFGNHNALLAKKI